MRPWNSASGPRKKGLEYTFKLERVYAPAGLADCDLLELRPPFEAFNTGAIFRTGAGEMIVPEAQNPLGFAIMSAEPYWYFASSQTKATLGRAGLLNVLFRPTVLVPRVEDFDEAGAPVEVAPDLASIVRSGRDLAGPIDYWELDGDFTMPPLSPSMEFVDAGMKSVLSGDFANGFQRKDGFYTHPELHYRASDLAALPEFDLARTYEPFSNRSGRDSFDCPLVASRRFYDFCVASGLETGWVPVRIDRE